MSNKKENFVHYRTLSKSKHLASDDLIALESLPVTIKRSYLGKDLNNRIKEQVAIIEFEELTRDTKTSWNLDSFPASVESALAQTNATDYEWQGRGYMMLLNEHGIAIKRHSVDYCLVDTPLHLIIC